MVTDHKTARVSFDGSGVRTSAGGNVKWALRDAVVRPRGTEERLPIIGRHDVNQIVYQASDVLGSPPATRSQAQRQRWSTRLRKSSLPVIRKDWDLCSRQAASMNTTTWRPQLSPTRSQARYQVCTKRLHVLRGSWNRGIQGTRPDPALHTTQKRSAYPYAFATPRTFTGRPGRLPADIRWSSTVGGNPNLKAG